MINYVYQLVSPHCISVKYEDVNINNDVIIRPKYMSLCHADQRYYLGKRDLKTLNEKLPMALIHECCGEVLHDNTNTFKKGEIVVLIPNNPQRHQPHIYENYDETSLFSSSTQDGFMREFVNLPAQRVVSVGSNIPTKCASICELVSVAMHAVTRMELTAHKVKDTFAIWGDGSVAYIVACILKEKYPKSELVVIGKNPNKLSQFSFVNRTYITHNLPDKLKFDHAFECVGGEGSNSAIDEIIANISPQGTIALLGVSENRVPINTRLVLEKGLTLLGCSRSGREDFISAIEFMNNPKSMRRLSSIIFETAPVYNITDIHNAFATDLTTPFKTVFKWNL